jgi:TetR/AcrR family transcriptional regulator, tetracycline repressor protein
MGDPSTADLSTAVPPPPWRRARGRARARQPLSQERIVDAAMKIVDAEGLDALSMRRLGDELSTTASALYAHVADKEELLDLMFDRFMGELEVPEFDPESWREQIKEFARQSRRVLAGHRDFARATMARAPFGPNGLLLIEKMLAFLRPIGLPDEIAVYIGDLFGSFVATEVIESHMYEQAARAGHDPMESATQVKAYIESLPKDLFPNLTAVTAPMFQVDDSGKYDRFELGLEILLRGIESYLPLSGPS